MARSARRHAGLRVPDASLVPALGGTTGAAPTTHGCLSAQAGGRSVLLGVNLPNHIDARAKILTANRGRHCWPGEGVIQAACPKGQTLLPRRAIAFALLEDDRVAGRRQASLRMQGDRHD